MFSIVAITSARYNFQYFFYFQNKKCDDSLDNQPTLKRTITLPLLTLYGLGTIVGAGIYVLVGEVVKEAGLFAPLSFVLAAIIAAFTAFTYAELSSRFPRSAGEAYYCQQAFNKKLLSGFIGWSIVAIGVISTATIVNGFVGYFNVYLVLPSWMIIVGLIIILSLVAVWGISESVWLAAIITLIECSGLVFVIYIAAQVDAPAVSNIGDFFPPLTGSAWFGIVIGGFLAFYAYIGFEDMVNVAEEVIHPRRTLPLSILLALVVSTLLYVSVSIAAIVTVPVMELGVSKAPLVDIVKHAGDKAVTVMTVVSMIAVVNGALIQIIMASRVMYGMACQQLAPYIFSRVNAKTHTPIWATAVITLVILILALAFSLVTLAKATSFVTLTVFSMMHLSLIVVKRKEPQPAYAMVYPSWLPITGLIVTMSLLIFQTWATFVT